MLKQSDEKQKKRKQTNNTSFKFKFFVQVKNQDWDLICKSKEEKKGLDLTQIGLFIFINLILGFCSMEISVFLQIKKR